MHKLIMTSNVYRLASSGDSELMKRNLVADPSNRFLWSFRLQRLEAEPIWDSILTAAGNLDTTLGGPSFDIEARAPRGRGGPVDAGREDEPPWGLYGAWLFHEP